MRIRKVLIFSLILALFSFSLFAGVSRVLALDADEEIAECKDKSTSDEQRECLEDLQERWQKKHDELSDQVDSLTNEISSVTNQIQLTETKIQVALSGIKNTESEIDKLSDNIDSIKARIVKLQNSMDYQKQVLNERMRERYKSKSDNPLMVLFGESTLDNLVEKAEYLQKMAIYDNKLLTEMANTRDAYNAQKALYENKKSEQEDLKAKLQNQKASLDTYKGDLSDQKSQKQNLLEDTQGSEQKYQEMLQKAEQELASYRSFTQSAGGGAIGSNGFGNGKKGWYFSQRDSRWAYATIGNSRDNIIDVGCLVTSIAMVYKSHGSKVTPATIAKRDIYYGNTAYMVVPGDFKSTWGSYSNLSDAIDSQLKKGNPVIVGVYSGPYGTHFIVLASKSGSDYVIYDPWYGPDLKLSSHYSKNSIFEMIVFK